MTIKSLRLSIVLALSLLVLGCIVSMPGLQKGTLPAKWPLKTLNKQQISDVKSCDLENLAQDRYPESIKTNELETAYTPKTDCDWAVLALAYSKRLGENEPMSEAGKTAFSKAITNNYGFAFTTPLFYNYFGAIQIVDPPSFSQQVITDLRIQYNWTGLGNEVNYVVEIHNANTSPTINITPASVSTSANLEVNSEKIQALSTSLGNLLPVNSDFSLVPCYDNYPRWTVGLTFQDKKTLVLETYSNFIPIGGPWKTRIGEQNYVQFSMDFIKSLDEIISDSELPYGQPMAWSCFGNDDVFELAFP